MLFGQWLSRLPIIIIALLPALASAEPAQNDKTTIVVDAGSSGSRLYFYQYIKDSSSGLPVIHSQKSVIQQGGIQSLPSNNLAPYMDKLFSSFKGRAPDRILFYSTAGMRLLSPGNRASINKAITKYLSKAFPRSTIDVKTISGQKEGIYGWLALNYLNEAFARGTPSEGVLDLGGASTEVTYECGGKDAVTMTINHQNRRVCSASFLGLGLTMAMAQFVNEPTCFPKGYPLPSGEKGTGNFTACADKIKPLVDKVHNVPAYINAHHMVDGVPSFVAISAYDYTAIELGIDKAFSIKSLERQGQAFCSQQWHNLTSGSTRFKVTPYLFNTCFAAAFEKDLYTHGYGLNTRNIPIKTASTIKGKKLNWALGALL
ncbi:hypothetical protein [Candidatus Sororendozoicomonas aggregata]|uniref:hypothetical protein n=1 Tax=Candidatus Sororendozoicomonas aggregata TaxID=3073239 RepID=UPI002ED01CED